MYLCYVDESGTSDVPGNTSHFVLAGISIPVSKWREADQQISDILKLYGLVHEEMHTGWLLRKYIEQARIPGFASLGWADRRSAAERARHAHLLALQKSQNRKAYRQVKKTYNHTRPYIHLTYNERVRMVHAVADCVASWDSAKIFVECIDKIWFDPNRTGRTVDEQAFEQVTSRFQHYLNRPDQHNIANPFGLIVHDNNETVARKHTHLMRQFHEDGTLWTQIERIIETPLFVDSRLTRMVQIADLCSYAFRRYLENKETELFRRLYLRADRLGSTVVGARHFTARTCKCIICQGHRKGVKI